MFAFPSLGISNMDVVQALLLGLAILLWRALKLVELIAANLGCNPHRTQKIKELDRKTDKVRERRAEGRSTKLTEAEEKALFQRFDELLDGEFRESPARAGQLMAVNERLETLTKLLGAGG